MEGNPQTVVCAVYCRYSSEAQRDGFSIEAQKRACSDFITKQGWKLHKFYVDEARSGSSDDRQSFQELIADACVKFPPFRYICVHKLDRFARNRYDSVRYKWLLNKHGVKVISASQPIVGSGDPTEVLLESLLEGMDEFYSINLAREAIKGMAENARNGWYNGGFPPFGYDLTTVKTPKGMKRKLVINASEAKIVRHIFREYLKGKGIVTLTLALNSHDLRIRGGRPFSKNTVANILHNEKYAGDMAFGSAEDSVIIAHPDIVGVLFLALFGAPFQPLFFVA